MSKLPAQHDREREIAERNALETKAKAEKVTEALSEGKLPTTRQVTSTITKIQESDILHEVSTHMSPAGKRVLSDTERLLETTKQVLREKNRGDQLQNMLYYGTQAAKDFGDKVSVPTDIPEDIKAKARGETAGLVKEGVSKGANIVRLLIAQPEFRRIIGDLHSLVQDSIDQGFEKIDRSVQKSFEKLDKTSQEVGRTDDPAEAMKRAKENIIEDPETIDRTDKAMDAYRDGDKERVAEHDEHVKNRVADKTKSKLEKFKMSKERREQLVTRFKNLTIQSQNTPEYQQAIQDIISIISQVSQSTQEITTKVAQAGEPLAEGATTPSVEEVERNAKELLENFANHRSLDHLIIALRELAEKVRTHEDLFKFFHELREFVLKSLLEPDFVNETNYTAHGSDLIERGRRLLLEQYGDITRKIASEAALFNKGLQEDSTTNRLKKDLEILTKDLFLDEKNKPAFKLELVKDVAKIIQAIGKKFDYIAVPRIEHADDQNEFIFDNIVLHIPQLLARHIHLNLTADIDLDRPDDQILENTITLDVKKIGADARNIAFFYRQKSGVKWMDVGHIDFAIPEESGGLGIHMKLLLNVSKDEHTPSTFRVVELHSHLSELKIRLHNTKHDFLYKLVTPLYEKRIKKQVESSINDMLRNAITYIDTQISTMQKKAKEFNARKATETFEEEESRQKQPWESPAFVPQFEPSTSTVPSIDRP
ncbi:856_t:CDS:10 [Ambispora gerdemannii]|uniref:856_t:CDS:1 n=1 Tax=Ambispora gerdemannii TaxID=144530 RepID=A0A9N9G2P4_9GLOM|nr:856_t:CDS:10 [Ambispora gerdemannii]